MWCRGEKLIAKLFIVEPALTTHIHKDIWNRFRRSSCSIIIIIIIFYCCRSIEWNEREIFYIKLNFHVISWKLLSLKPDAKNFFPFVIVRKYFLECFVQQLIAEKCVFLLISADFSRVFQYLTKSLSDSHESNNGLSKVILVETTAKRRAKSRWIFHRHDIPTSRQLFEQSRIPLNNSRSQNHQREQRDSSIAQRELSHRQVIVQPARDDIIVNGSEQYRLYRKSSGYDDAEKRHIYSSSASTHAAVEYIDGLVLELWKERKNYVFYASLK